MGIFFDNLEKLPIEEQNKRLKGAVKKLLKYIRELKTENVKLKTTINRVEKICGGDGFGL
jgi:hypothetical protein